MSRLSLRPIVEHRIRSAMWGMGQYQNPTDQGLYRTGPELVPGVPGMRRGLFGLFTQRRSAIRRSQRLF